jgi:hypothetical protein
VLRDPDGNPAGIIGTIAEIVGTTLTVEKRSGDAVQLLTDENTQFLVPGAQDAAISALKIGDTIGAQVIERADGFLYTSAVKVASAQPILRRGSVLGRIDAVEGHALRLATRRGEITVQTDERTRFRMAGVEEPGLDDLKIGQIIAAAGHWNRDGSLQAQVIGARQAP